MSNWSKTIIALVILTAMVAVTTAAAEAHPDERCYGIQTVNGPANTFFAGINPGGQPVFAGVADFRVGGLRYDGVAVTTTLLDPATTSHAIEFPLGTVTTEDALILLPTEDPLVMSLRTRLAVVSGGTGRLHLLPASTLTFAPNPQEEPPVIPVAAAWEMRGHICFDD